MNWCLLESDPGVFTELSKEIGATNVQVEEIWSLDEDTLNNVGNIYGFLFLFKWTKKETSNGGVPNENVFFMKQVINNACGTIALLHILLNQSDLDVGETLTDLKSFLAGMDPVTAGECLANAEKIRNAHNSFAKSQSFELEKADEDEADNYHFIAYTQRNGKVYELDGLTSGPREVADAGTNWQLTAAASIQERMNTFANDEVHFNLMAVIEDRSLVAKRKLYKSIQSIDTLQSILLSMGESLLDIEEKIMTATEAIGNTSFDDFNRDELYNSYQEGSPELIISKILEIVSELDEHIMTIRDEAEKMEMYRIENKRRKHDFNPLIFGCLDGLAKRGKLQKLFDKAVFRN